MTDLLISKIKVKTFLKQNDMRVSKDFYEAMNDEIKEMLLKMVNRAKGNRRSTILMHDL